MFPRRLRLFGSPEDTQRLIVATDAPSLRSRARLQNERDLPQATFDTFSDLHRLWIGRHVVKHRTEILPVALGDGGFTQVCGRQQGGKEGEVSTMSAPTTLVVDGVSRSLADKRTYQIGASDHPNAPLDRDLDAL